MNHRLICGAILATVLAAGGGTAHAVLFESTDDPLFHATAPGGAYTGSGWQYEGSFGQVLGTVISPNHFITAAHAGFESPVFIYDGISYPIVSRSVIPGTDLMVAEVSGTFSQWAPLYTGSEEIGSETVITGRGGPRGAAILDGDGSTLGWSTASSDGVLRWGANTVDASIQVNGLGAMMVATFDSSSGPFEAGLSSNDSGGGAFINDGGVWKLAGITYGADTFATDATGAGKFTAALLDPTGFYRYDDASGSWQEQTATDGGTRYYFSQISASAEAISDLAQVPEPATAAMLALACAGLLRRKRRS